MHLLFVCTGNTCRSPMAELLAKSKFEALGLDWKVRSAGLYAIPGIQISEGARKTLIRRRITGDGHESALISESLVNQADYIFTMTFRHKQDMLAQFPHLSGKVFTIGSYACLDKNKMDESEATNDVVDPFGQSEEVYESCALMLEQHIDRLVAKILLDVNQKTEERPEGDE